MCQTWTGLVVALHEERLAVRRPPVPAVAIEFLGRDELGETEHDLLGIVFCRTGGPARRLVVTRQVDHEHRSVGCKGDSTSGWVDPRIDDAARRRYLPHPAFAIGQQAHLEQPRGQREDCRRHLTVGGVGDDAGRPDPHALPPCPFGSGQVLTPTLQQRRGLGDPPFHSVLHVEDPQIVASIGAACRAEEHHSLAIGAHADVARCTQGEVHRACREPREALFT